MFRVGPYSEPRKQEQRRRKDRHEPPLVFEKRINGDRVPRMPGRTWKDIHNRPPLGLLVVKVAGLEDPEMIESYFGQHSDGFRVLICNVGQTEWARRHHDVKVFREHKVPVRILLLGSHSVNHACPKIVLECSRPLGGHEHIGIARFIRRFHQKDVRRALQVRLNRFSGHEIQIGVETPKVIEQEVPDRIDSLNVVRKMSPRLPELGVSRHDVFVEVLVGPKHVNPVGMQRSPRF